jgi:excisionase family DNA binding protein
MNQSSLFYTPKEIADLLKVSERTVRRWIGEGKLWARRFGQSSNLPGRKGARRTETGSLWPRIASPRIGTTTRTPSMIVGGSTMAYQTFPFVGEGEAGDAKSGAGALSPGPVKQTGFGGDGEAAAAGVGNCDALSYQKTSSDPDLQTTAPQRE